MDAELERVAERMVHRYIRWRIDFAVVNGYSKSAYQEYRDDMLRLLDEQHALMRSTLDEVITHVPSSLPALLQVRGALEQDLQKRREAIHTWPPTDDRFETDSAASIATTRPRQAGPTTSRDVAPWP